MLNINITELLAEEEAFHQILTLVKRRKLWESFSYVAINAPEVSLKMLLTTMLYDLMILPEEEKSIVQTMLKDKKLLDTYSEKLGSSSEDDNVNEETEIE
jgi:hypothetical protein